MLSAVAIITGPGQTDLRPLEARKYGHAIEGQRPRVSLDNRMTRETAGEFAKVQVRSLFSGA